MAKSPFQQLPEPKKDAIYRVCLELFAKYGYGNTSIKMIANRLRVADGFLYYYFNGKQDLANWMIERGLVVWKDHFDRYVRSKNPHGLFELFKLSVLQMTRFIREERDLFGAYAKFINEPGFPLAERIVKGGSWIDEVYRDAIEAEIRDGSLRSDLSPEVCAMVLDVVNTRIQEFVFNPKLDPVGVSEMDDEKLSVFVDQLVGLFRNGMASTG